jgi:hypothetical protein
MFFFFMGNPHFFKNTSILPLIYVISELIVGTGGQI